MSNILPTLLSSLLGREQETATLRQLLKRADVRLVTITGPGGVGKTSLALQVVHELEDDFLDGVFFISLAPINDPTLIIPTIAQLLGVTESPNRLLLDSLKDFLRNKRMLLLLDNFEQIVTAAPLLTELLESYAEVRMLVTSREALRLRGEHVFPLEPLGSGDHIIRSGDQPVDILLRHPAIALFVRRVQDVQPDFRLTKVNAPAVAEICAHLDGLPLTLELAARIKLLPPQAMLERLQNSSLQLLTSGARDLPARQQTLRSAIQWSYDLLDYKEQVAFRWFAIFVSGSTLDAAQAVIGPSASMDVLESLVSKSLLRQAETEGEPRLTMLETIREFGLEQLSNACEVDSARRTHAEYYQKLVEASESELAGAAQKVWLQRLDHEHDNLRCVIRWALENHEPEIVQKMSGALWRFWIMRGYWSEGRRWLEESITESSSVTAPSTLAKLLYGASMLARYQSDFARARKLIEQCITINRTLDDKAGLLGALIQLSRVIGFQADTTELESLISEALVLAEELPDSPEKAQAYLDVVIILPLLTNSHFHSEAATYLAESERIHRTLNNLAGVGSALNMQASLATREGDFTQASAYLDEADRLAVEIGDYRLSLRTAAGRVQLESRRGDIVSARKYLEKYIQLGQSLDDIFMPYALQILAGILQRQGLSAWAARVFGLADSWRGANQVGPGIILTAEDYRELADARAQVRAKLGEAAIAKEWAVGQKMTLDDVLAIPQSVVLNKALPLRPDPASFPNASLTSRELEVLLLLVEELSNPQIAERLVISRRTVDAHLRSIYDKLGTKSRDAALRVAREQGLLDR